MGDIGYMHDHWGQWSGWRSDSALSNRAILSGTAPPAPTQDQTRLPQWMTSGKRQAGAANHDPGRPSCSYGVTFSSKENEFHGCDAAGIDLDAKDVTPPFVSNPAGRRGPSRHPGTSG